MTPATEGASHSNPPNVELAHLVCYCQLSARPRRSLCGADVTTTYERSVSLPSDRVQPCVVCLDLARTVLVARRCGRCPT